MRVLLDGGKKEPTGNKSKLNDLLSVGVWILIPYGFQKQEFCVLKKLWMRLLLGNKKWLVSSAMWVPLGQLEAMDGTILGKGRYRWWRKALPFINDLILPYSAYR